MSDKFIKTVEIGVIVRDRLTKFSGRVIGLVDYITGSSQAFIQPGIKNNGDFVEPRWIDIERLEVLPGPKMEFDKL